MSRTTRRLAAAVAAAGVAAFTIAGVATAATPAAQPLGRCHTGDLTASLTGEGAATAHLGTHVLLTNTSDTPCRMFGYGGAELLDANGNPTMPTRLDRTPNPGPRLFTLAPGQSAAKMLYWQYTDDPGAPTGQCEPNPAIILVTPPDETASLRLPWPYGPVCNQGRILGSAYAPAQDVL